MRIPAASAYSYRHSCVCLLAKGGSDHDESLYSRAKREDQSHRAPIVRRRTRQGHRETFPGESLSRRFATHRYVATVWVRQSWYDTTPGPYGWHEHTIPCQVLGRQVGSFAALIQAQAFVTSSRPTPYGSAAPLRGRHCTAVRAFFKKPTILIALSTSAD